MTPQRADEDSHTDDRNVLESAPRTRAAVIAGDIIEGLKGTIRHNRVTLDEFREAVDFIRAVVQDGELDLLSAVLFEAVVDEASETATSGTASNVEGPYYRASAPVLRADGTPALPMRPDEPGDPLTFSGIVRSTAGHALPSATLDIWQADDEGLYSQFAPGIPEWNLRGRIGTDEQGRFAFRTVVPSAYDLPGLPHTARLLGVLGMEPHRPAHVHFKVSADGHQDLTTQVYFSDDPWLDKDVVGAARPALVTDLRDGPEGTTGRVCTFDITLEPLDPHPTART